MKKEDKKIRAKVYIDGANIFYAQKHLGWTIDWKKIIVFLKKKFNVSEIKYYTGIKNQDDKMKKYLSYLRDLNIKTITKPLKIIQDKTGRTIYKSNCDIEIAIDILLDANNYDVLVLFSGDSDFVYLIKILQKQFQKQVHVFSTRRTISWETKMSVDKFWFIEDLKKEIKRS